jgi:ribosomal protein S16
MWVYRRVEQDGRTFFRCGFYDPLDVREKWISVKEFVDELDAMRFVSWMNGGAEPKPKKATG